MVKNTNEIPVNLAFHYARAYTELHSNVYGVKLFNLLEVDKILSIQGIGCIPILIFHNYYTII